VGSNQLAPRFNYFIMDRTTGASHLAVIFSCSPSIVALLIIMHCVQSTREVPPVLVDLILPPGATSNLNGTAVYMPLAYIFTARVGCEDTVC
jgi:Na+/H+-dicarboxylate symporter